MSETDARRGHWPVGECPYCGETVHADEPRGLDHRGRLTHLPCLDDEDDGPCSICEQPLLRRQPRAPRGAPAHLVCPDAARAAPPLVLDVLLVAMTEVGIARGRLRGGGDEAGTVRAAPATIAELNRLAGAVYFKTFAGTVGLPVIPDASLNPGHIEVDGGAGPA